VFDALITVVISASVLASLNTTALFYIEINSFNYTIGAILFQKSKINSKWYSVTFFRKSLSLIKCNYEIYNKEMLLII